MRRAASFFRFQQLQVLREQPFVQRTEVVARNWVIEDTALFYPVIASSELRHCCNGVLLFFTTARTCSVYDIARQPHCNVLITRCM